MLSIFSKRKIQIEVQLSDIFAIFWVFFSLNWNTTFSHYYISREHSISFQIHYSMTISLYSSFFLRRTLFSYSYTFIPLLHCINKTIIFNTHYSFYDIYNNYDSICAFNRFWYSYFDRKRIVEWDKQIKVKRTQKQICKVIL